MFIVYSVYKGKIYLVDSIDTSGHPHEYNFLCELSTIVINKAEEHYGCHIGSFATDNAANVMKMRNEL